MPRDDLHAKQGEREREERKGNNNNRSSNSNYKYANNIGVISQQLPWGWRAARSESRIALIRERKRERYRDYRELPPLRPAHNSQWRCVDASTEFSLHTSCVRNLQLAHTHTATQLNGGIL